MDEEFDKFYSECSALDAASQDTESSLQEKGSDNLAEVPASSTEHSPILNSSTQKATSSRGDNEEHSNTDNIISTDNKQCEKSELVHKQQNALGTVIDIEPETEISKQIKTSEVDKDKEGKEIRIDNYSLYTRYEGHKCIYTNPDSKEEYVWNTQSKEWVLRGHKPQYDGKTTRFTDAEGDTYDWDADRKEWIKTDDVYGSQYGFDGENHTYTDSRDNTVYIWDKEKSAWFPKVDDDFMARYQMSYGFVDNTTKVEEPKQEERKIEKRKPSEPSWFDLDDEHNTKVYVSNLPENLTEQEFIDFMQKCGLIQKDLKTGKFKIKLYKEPNGTFKGDALCDYIKIESVQLSLNVLDGAEVRGKKVTVQRAKFQMRGDYNPALKPKKKRKKEKEQEKKVQQKLLDWRPDKLRGEREKHERTVVIKNLFDPKLFDDHVELILEYTEDIRSEASKCGQVRKVTLYDKNPEGVATITFSDAEEADICIKLLNNRWFGKRRVIAQGWDGKTKYKVIETTEETKQRLDNWNRFLESEDRIKL